MTAGGSYGFSAAALTGMAPPVDHTLRNPLNELDRHLATKRDEVDYDHNVYKHVRHIAHCAKQAVCMKHTNEKTDWFNDKGVRMIPVTRLSERT